MRKLYRTEFPAAVRLAAYFFAAVVLPALVMSCRTPPSYREADPFSWFSPGGDIYMRVPVAGNNAMIEYAVRRVFPDVRETDMDRLLDRTDMIWLAVYGAGSGAPRYEMAAAGRYPSRFAGFVFPKKYGWKKVEPSGGSAPFPYYEAGGIQAALPASSFLLSASSGMDGLLERFVSPPALAWPAGAAFMTVSAADGGAGRLFPETQTSGAFYVPRPGIFFEVLLGSDVRLPVQYVAGVFSFSGGGAVSEGTYTADIYMAVSEPRFVRAAAALLNLSLKAIPGAENVIIETDGSSGVFVRNLSVTSAFIDVLLYGFL